MLMVVFKLSVISILSIDKTMPQIKSNLFFPFQLTIKKTLNDFNDLAILLIINNYMAVHLILLHFC